MSSDLQTKSSRRIAGPFNRVEGDLEVQLEVDGDRVNKAWVVAPLYRGFEQILQGKPPLDALVYVPRICGICSVAQSVAAANALAHLGAIAPTPNGQLATNLILANENLADHLTHFYLFFMPDFARATYQNEPWFDMTAARFKAVTGSATKTILPARAKFLHLMGMLAGKWPHSLALQPGGTTRAVEASEKMRLLAIVFEFRQFLETQLFGDRLENIMALDSEAALNAWCDQRDAQASDFRHFLHLAQQLDLHLLGRAQDRFMSYGVYPDTHKPDQTLFTAGVFDCETQRLNALQQSAIAEDISHSWMQHQAQPAHPFDGVTQPCQNPAQGPSQDKPDAYSWCKSPRWEGKAVEVGALARQVVDGHPLLRDLVAGSGGNVRNRIIARLLELALVTVQMEQWAKALQPKAPFCNTLTLPEEGRGFGLMEAARGSLGHWIKVERGQIANYQIIAPTTWNFSPRDASAQPGPLELALQGARLRDDEIQHIDKDPVSVQHIVRSFDPCMVCTVH